MKRTPGPISREQALQINSRYVEYIEGNYDVLTTVLDAQNKLKKGQLVM